MEILAGILTRHGERQGEYLWRRLHHNLRAHYQAGEQVAISLSSLLSLRLLATTHFSLQTRKKRDEISKVSSQNAAVSSHFLRFILLSRQLQF